MGDGLRRRDYRAALDFIALLGEAADLDDFAARFAFGLDGVIACRAASYNEINLRRRRVRWITGIETGPEHVLAFEHHIRENPVLNHFARHPLCDAVKVSDLVGQRRWRDLGVYRDLYHPLGCEQILAVEVAAGPVSIAVAAFRDGRDFSERDRTMMTVLRPHLANAYRNATLASDLGGHIALLHRGIEIGGFGAIVLAADGRIVLATEKARRWLAEYFGVAENAGRLPQHLAAWVRQGCLPAAGTPPAPCRPFAVERGGKRLIAHLLERDGKRLILMEERRTTLAAENLAALGLTRRESEILAWLANGKADAEIAAILDISPRTVSHTLEKVYRKLGVETRVAAAARALRAAVS